MEEEKQTDEVNKILEEKRNELVVLIEAFAKLDESKEWNVLRELVFDKSLKSIERQLLNESLAVEVSQNKIYRLQGEWVWAKQFCDVKRFIETLKTQLADINKKIK